jgi:hypothetical protein
VTIRAKKIYVFVCDQKLCNCVVLTVLYMIRENHNGSENNVKYRPIHGDTTCRRAGLVVRSRHRIHQIRSGSDHFGGTTAREPNQFFVVGRFLRFFTI